LKLNKILVLDKQIIAKRSYLWNISCVRIAYKQQHISSKQEHMKSTTSAASIRSSREDLTVERFCRYVAPRAWDKDKLLTWPPDVFAVSASLLLKSGAYCHAVSGWKRKPSLSAWVEKLYRIGEDWQKNVKKAPTEVHEWHQTLIANSHVLISEIRRNRKLCEALLELCAASDEACAGVGFKLYTARPGEFLYKASDRLVETLLSLNISTLGKEVDHSVLRILPKLHTPQSGITIRSLTHNLALCPSGDVSAKWAEWPRTERHCFNLLLAPWPLIANPLNFLPVKPAEAELEEMPSRFGFFTYDPQLSGDSPYRRLNKLLKNAKRVVSEIHGVVFPELSVTRDQYLKIREALMKKGIFFICGVRERPSLSKKRSKGRSTTKNAGKNYLQFDVPFLTGIASKPVVTERGFPLYASHRQNKHHRWRLDKRQIIQYGLGSCLDIERDWWEHISIQDPVAELVRAVGPNLVIALLMDGPQLTSRWPARYATVLADDPGCSVLTLTSIGMTELSRPPSITTHSRAVALWKDAKTGEAQSIDLPSGAEGVVLSLSREFEKEWSADGRDDHGTTGYPILSGIHPIF
jgi:hypothetical protein